MNINFRDDKIDAMKAVVDPKQLTDKVQQLKNLEDEIRNAEEGVKKLKEQARIISELEIPSMMKEMNITKQQDRLFYAQWNLTAMGLNILPIPEPVVVGTFSIYMKVN